LKFIVKSPMEDSYEFEVSTHHDVRKINIPFQLLQIRGFVMILVLAENEDKVIKNTLKGISQVWEDCMVEIYREVNPTKLH
jgi:hypothetical protein